MIQPRISCSTHFERSSGRHTTRVGCRRSSKRGFGETASTGPQAAELVRGWRMISGVSSVQSPAVSALRVRQVGSGATCRGRAFELRSGVGTPCATLLVAEALTSKLLRVGLTPRFTPSCGAAHTCGQESRVALDRSGGRSGTRTDSHDQAELETAVGEPRGAAARLVAGAQLASRRAGRGRQDSGS